MNMISTEESLNVIAWVLYFGSPIVILLLIWIGLNLKAIKDKLDK